MPRKNQTLKFRRAVLEELDLWIKEMTLMGYSVMDETCWSDNSVILSVQVGDDHVPSQRAVLSSISSRDPRKKWKVFCHAMGPFSKQPPYAYGTSAYETLEDATFAIGKWMGEGTLSDRGRVWSS